MTYCSNLKCNNRTIIRFNRLYSTVTQYFAVTMKYSLNIESPLINIKATIFACRIYLTYNSKLLWLLYFYLCNRSELLILHGDEELPQQGMNKNRIEQNTCSWSTFDKAIGIKVCASYQVTYYASFKISVVNTIQPNFVKFYYIIFFSSQI